MSYIQQFFTSRDNNANAQTFVGQEGRLWWNPDTNQIYSSDGNTPGGIPLAGGGGGNGTPGGSNSQVQFNQAGGFGGSANLTFNSVNGTLTAVSFVGNGAGLTSIAGANVTGTVADATHATVADSANSIAGGNVTGNVSNAVHAYFADVANSVTGSNVTGTVANATYATSAGSATTATSATTAATVTTNAQPNITSVGTLTSITSSGNISTTGNVTGNFHIGNGSLLTGIVSSYGNANVAANLAAFGSNPISTTGNVTAGNIIATNITTTAGNLYGNNGTYNNPNFITPFIGDGDWAYGLYSNGVVVFTQTKFWGGGDTAHGYRVYDTFGAGNTRFSVDGTGNTNLQNISATGFISATGNVTGNFHIGNGSLLTGIVSSYGNANVVANLAALGSNPVSTTGNVTGGNLLTGGSVSATGNITAGSNSNYYGLSGVTKSITVVAPTTGYAALDVVGSAGNAGTINLGNVNRIHASIDTDSTRALFFYVNVLGTANAVSQAVAIYPNLNASFSNAVTATANITGGNILTAGVISSTGNATGGNLLTSGNIAVTNLTTSVGELRFSDGTQTSNLFGVGSSAALYAGPSSLNLNTGSTAANIGLFVGSIERGRLTNTGLTVTGIMSASGNVTSSNLITGGLATVTGNITGGNLNTGAQVVATGNITGGNLLTGGLAAVTGNITGGNLLTAGLISATGNITGANANVNGLATVTYAPATTVGAGIQVSAANTQGGSGYADFLKATNTTTGATNPNKWFRIGSTGTMEIINSAYTGSLFSLTDAGALSTSQLQINGKKAVNGPAFRAWANDNQTITSGSQQKVTFTQESFDTDNCFASSRFTPNVEGYYQFNSTVRISGGSSTGEVMLILYKNGSEYARGTNESGTEQGASFYAMLVSDIAYANGTTDYFEIYIQQTSGTSKNVTSAATISYFSGVMVRGA